MASVIIGKTLAGFMAYVAANFPELALPYQAITFITIYLAHDKGYISLTLSWCSHCEGTMNMQIHEKVGSESSNK